MDLGSKEIWVGILLLLVVLIIIDGRRRLRARKYDRIHSTRRKQPIFDDDDPSFDPLRSEFPSGGARVVKQRDQGEVEELTQIIREVAEAKKPKLSVPLRTRPEQTALQFEEPTPVLMEPVIEPPADAAEDPAARENSSDHLPQQMTDDYAEDIDEDMAESREFGVEPESEIAPEVEHKAAPEAEPASRPAVKPTPEFVLEPFTPKATPARPARPEPKYEPKPAWAEVKGEFKQEPKQEFKSAEKPRAGKPNPDDVQVIVLHLMSRDDRIAGNTLLEAAVEQGFRYGAMKIFHYHAEEDGTGPIMFSMANSVNPGIFDLATMDSFSTPGVSFFMTLDENQDPLRAFDTMIEVVNAMANSLDGQIQDETRSSLTKQTVEHYRQRVKETLRKQQTRK